MRTQLRLIIVTGLTVCAALWAMPRTAHAQIFVSSFGSTTIGEYNLDGTTINPSAISGLGGNTLSIAVSGGDIFVADNHGTVFEYTTSGVFVDWVATGLSLPWGIAVSGEDVYVASEVTSSTGIIGEYTTSGATVNASLISGLNYVGGLAVSGTNLFVANFGRGTIGEYTTSGATVNASLVSGLGNPTGVAVEPTPEPTTLALAGLGGLSLMLFRRRRK